jgi:foldase protein PrsA
MFRSRWLLIPLLLLPLAGCGTTGQQAKDTPSTDATVVATVNGDKIAHDEWDKQLEARRGQEILQRLVMEKLIDQEAKKQNVSISKDQLKAKLDEYHQGKAYKEDLKSGVTSDLLDHELELTLVLRQLMLQEITEQDKLRFYDRFKDDLAEVEVAQILLTDAREADKVEGDLRNGADFAAEAKKYSKDPNTRDEGGVLGYVVRSQLDPSFTKVAFETPVGQVSPVFRSPFGYHILKVLDRKTTYDQLKTAVEDALLSQEMKPYEQRLQAKATITTVYDKDKSASTPPSGSPR